MKLVHVNTADTVTEKKLPMSKDPQFIAALRQAFINDHNAKFEKKQLKNKQA